VEIRSDLYSLGVVLWEMVPAMRCSGAPPAEVMYQRQHAPSPVHLLEAAPQPVVVLPQVLLKKDPTACPLLFVWAIRPYPRGN
jgi:hypothetical protein